MAVPVIRCTIDPAAPDAAASELLVLGPSLGTTTSLWGPVIDELADSNDGRWLRVLRFDLPGHGASPAARDGFTVAELADAVLRLVDETGGGRFHYAGVSFGGAIGLELALRYPHRLLSLALICTDARIGSPDGWADRAAQARTQGTASLVGGSAQRWFATGYLDRDGMHGAQALTELTEVDDESYAACAEALAAFDVRSLVHAIRVPTVTVSGAFDPVVPPEQMARLAGEIPNARAFTIDGASHLAVLENPVEVAKIIADSALRAEVGDVADAARTEQLAKGMSVRREVLGDAHVDSALGQLTPETEDFQDFITRYAWAEIWTRPGLARRERSIATLASLTTGGHDKEIAMHVRAALRNGLSRQEISEVILHTAIYAGVPAANSAFAIAREIFAEPDPGARRTRHKGSAD